MCVFCFLVKINDVLGYFKNICKGDCLVMICWFLKNYVSLVRVVSLEIGKCYLNF